MSDEKEDQREEKGAEAVRAESMSQIDFSHAAAGVGAAVSGARTVQPAAAKPHEEMTWDFEADVVVPRSGCTGLIRPASGKDLRISGWP